MPAGEHFAPEQRAAPQRRLDLVPRGGVRGVNLRPQLGCSRELLNHRRLDHRRPSGKARERTPKGPVHESRARLCIGSEIVEPCTNGRERRRGNETLRERSLRHDEHLRLGQAFVLEHLPQMRRHLATGVLRHAVENERERRSPVTRRTEEFPGHRVGVAGGRRDEEPSVCGGKELVGECAVLSEDGVDVG